MANNKMLIDASHPEETRVVVLRGNRIEEFDFESASKKPLRGNIYLAKVTRVEPSLQAAFVEYGGNRHGFLAFSEIHPDYYQIPVADRQALLEEEARERREEEEEEERPRQQQQQQRRSRRFRGRDRNAQRGARNGDVITEDAPQPDLAGFDELIEAQVHPEHGDSEPVAAEHADHDHAVQGHDVQASAEQAAPESSPAPASTQDSPAPVAEAASAVETPAPANDFAPQPVPAAEPVSAEAQPALDAAPDGETDGAEGVEAAPAADEAQPLEGEILARAPSEDEEDDEDEEGGEEEEESVEQLGGDDFEEARPARRTRRQYKIQEVIKRRQVLLVQVVKEERGNKGAALTTYLSLAGRYSVLMPNTARGGGISRKITDSDDRRRLREIAEGLDVPEGMGVILRTAGAARGKEEVQRDFEYLLRMWESVRELTLRSMAPALVYEEGSLIKRSIRDLYGKDIDEVTVAGSEGYKEARDFMGMLMPAHVSNVREWREQQPIFAKYGVEQQLDSMFSNVVTLKSGGYIVVNQTEALVAIDVNSGRSTREHNIEDTALRTNLEAADEVARQLRLRDLAGLIVVDFIDMEEYRNNRSVERRMKEALKNDRARIQVGRISHFGLLEMSRQRMRTGVLEGSSVPCPHCMGAGTVRSTASIALHVLRLIEDALIRNNQFNLIVRTRTEVALYILNQKRAHLRDLEERFGVSLVIAADDTLSGSNYHIVERGEPAIQPVTLTRPQQIRVDTIAPVYEEDEAETEDAEAQSAEGDSEGEDEASAGGETSEAERDRRRRRRRRRGGRNRESSGIEADAPQPSDDLLAVVAEFTELTPAPRTASPASGETPEGEATVGDAAQGEGSEAVSESGDEEGRFRNRRRRRRNGRGRDGETEPRQQDEASQDGNGPQNGSWVRSTEPDTGYEPIAAAAPEPVQAQPEASAPAAVAAEPAAPVAEAPAQQVAAPVAETPAPKEETPAQSEPAIERRQPELLPEAPPPSEKRGGWWQRARNALGGN